MATDKNRGCGNTEETGVQTNVSRRSLLRGVTLAGGAALIAATVASQPAEAKVPQTAAGYQDKPSDGKSCQTCTLFIAPSSCKLVDGKIDPNGYCRFYMKKS